MRTIGIGELQKNMGIFSHLTEPLAIVDKRKGKRVAVAYPVEKHQTDGIRSLAGKYSQYAKKQAKEKSFEEIRKIAMDRAMEERYGLSD